MGSLALCNAVAEPAPGAARAQGTITRTSAPAVQGLLGFPAFPIPVLPLPSSLAARPAEPKQLRMSPTQLRFHPPAAPLGAAKSQQKPARVTGEHSLPC